MWFDNNHNGITDDGDELSSLNSLNIDHIDLKYTNDPYNADDTIPEEKGARQEGKSYVYFNDGTKEKSISEFWFKVNNSTTIHDGEVTVGNVKNIEQAIADDETGTLYSLCLAFDYSTDIAEKHRLLKKILYFLTDSSEIVIDSRGGKLILTKQPDPIEEDIFENTSVVSESDIETDIVNETVIESENTIEQNSDAEIEETSGIDTDLVA